MKDSISKFVIKCIFWTHMLVATTSHIAVFLLIAGAINLIASGENFSFWIKGMLFGLLFFAGMYGVNHVTNQEGFCFLTDLENFYRKRNAMPQIGVFMPRYYREIRSWFRCRQRLE